MFDPLAHSFVAGLPEGRALGLSPEVLDALCQVIDLVAPPKRS